MTTPAAPRRTPTAPTSNLPLEEAAARLHELLAQPGGPDGGLPEAQALSADLHLALPLRFVIERAKGVVMGALGCDADEAWQELRRESQRTNRPVRDLAHELAAVGRLPWRPVPPAPGR